MKTVNVSVGQNGINVWKGKGFGLFSGKLNTRGLTEGVIGETISNTVGYDWGGNLATGANNLAVEGAGYAAYGAGVVKDSVVNFAKDVKEFSNLAANFRKK